MEFRSWGGGRQRRVEATKSLSGARKRKASRREAPTAVTGPGVPKCKTQEMLPFLKITLLG